MPWDIDIVTQIPTIRVRSPEELSDYLLDFMGPFTDPDDTAENNIATAEAVGREMANALSRDEADLVAAGLDALKRGFDLQTAGAYEEPENGDVQFPTPLGANDRGRKEDADDPSPAETAPRRAG